jgi:predicted DCC family thiol-disulfide oxidoreductase YuxK
MKNGIILFDGVCNLCSQSVQFIIQRDPDAYYRFSSLQSDNAQTLRNSYQIPEEVNSILLIEQNHVYTHSTAVLRICRNLSGAWRWLYLFIIIPRPIRDLLYTILAKNRYQWFGKQAHCMVPTSEIKQRFID